MWVRTTVYAAIALVVLIGVAACTSETTTRQDGQQGDGAALFAENCARCHGVAADGTNMGPPLVHRLYEPGHHPDFSFQSAVKNGVIAHHWNFGDMPPVAGLSEDDVAQIVAYVRELQREGGIIR